MAASDWIDSSMLDAEGGVSGSGLTEDQDAILRMTLEQAVIIRKMQTNKAVISGDGGSVVVFDDDGTTPFHAFSISKNQLTRTPA